LPACLRQVAGRVGFICYLHACGVDVCVVLERSRCPCDAWWAVYSDLCVLRGLLLSVFTGGQVGKTPSVEICKIRTLTDPEKIQRRP